MAAPPPPAVGRPASSNSGTYFFGSQIGGGSVINYSYTDMPWKLLAWDAYYFFKFFWAVPYLVWPFYPADSAELSELSPTRENVFCIVVHAVLCVVQLAGLVALPGLALLPGWAAGLLVTLFLLFNHALCWMLNSKDVEYHSDPKYAPILPQHAHEQWIYINGVAAGYVQGARNTASCILTIYQKALDAKQPRPPRHHLQAANPRHSQQDVG